MYLNLQFFTSVMFVCMELLSSITCTTPATLDSTNTYCVCPIGQIYVKGFCVSNTIPLLTTPSAIRLPLASTNERACYFSRKMQSNTVIYANLSFNSCSQFGAGNVMQQSVFMYTSFIQNVTISSLLTLLNNSTFAGLCGGYSQLFQVERLKINVQLSSPLLQYAVLFTVGAGTFIVYDAQINFSYANTTGSFLGLIEVVQTLTDIRILTLSVTATTSGDAFGIARQLNNQSYLNYVDLTSNLYSFNNQTNTLIAGLIGFVENVVNVSHLTLKTVINGTLCNAGGVFAYAGVSTVASLYVQSSVIQVSIKVNKSSGGVGAMVTSNSSHYYTSVAITGTIGTSNQQNAGQIFGDSQTGMVLQVTNSSTKVCGVTYLIGNTNTQTISGFSATSC